MSYDDWKVTVPDYDAQGVQIERFEITKAQADHDKLRAALNPQRPDRTIEPGWFTRLKVDDTLWMTDTPAEVRDLWRVDAQMRVRQGGTMLIAGMGLGVVVHRAIVTRGMAYIDVVERERRVVDAVGEHYTNLAKEHDCILNIHIADIHDWRPPGGRKWGIGFFDIWPSINMDDLPEVKRLRDRFRSRLTYFEAWAQSDRLGQAKRIRTGTGFY